MTRQVVCPYCQADAKLVTGQKIYPDPRKAFLWKKKLWECEPCKAWVGCHQDTDKPFGRLADADLRYWKQLAHAKFDPIWQARMVASGLSRYRCRDWLYKWLAAAMNLPADQCHIGEFDIDQCKLAIRLLGEQYQS